MEDKQQVEQPDSVLRREVPSRVMEIIIVLSIILLLLFFLIVPVTWDHEHDARPVIDMSNLRQVVMAIYTYAVDHDGQLPEHILLAEEYLGDDSCLKSLYDQEESLSFDKTVKPGWYQYGSYWFLSTDRFTIDSDVEAQSIILAYRTPRPENNYYIVGFLDGHVESMDRGAFDELMGKQEELLPPTLNVTH